MINAHIVMKGVPRSLPQQIVDLPSLAYYSTGGLKKKWDLFYDQYLRQIKHKSAGYIFDFKGGIHSRGGKNNFVSVNLF